MGYVLAFGSCLVCNKPFGFNPNTVPSHRIGNDKKPICRTCMERINALRIEHGLDPFPIADDAYEPLNENELD